MNKFIASCALAATVRIFITYNLQASAANSLSAFKDLFVKMPSWIRHQNFQVGLITSLQNQFDSEGDLVTVDTSQCISAFSTFWDIKTRMSDTNNSFDYINARQDKGSGDGTNIGFMVS